MSITATDVKALRDKTNAPMMECKAALTEAGGDMEKATELLRENMKVQRFTRLTGLVGEYSHHDGTLGVLLQVEGAQSDPLVLRDVCMHIAARNPVSGTKEDVPAGTIAKEMEIAREQLANDPKN